MEPPLKEFRAPLIVIIDRHRIVKNVCEKTHYPYLRGTVRYDGRTGKKQTQEYGSVAPRCRRRRFYTAFRL